MTPTEEDGVFEPGLVPQGEEPEGIDLDVDVHRWVDDGGRVAEHE